MKRVRRDRLTAAAVLALGVLCLLCIVPASAGATTRHLGAGTATFSLDTTETLGFFAASMAPSPIYPARMALTASRVTFKMPIYGGTWGAGGTRDTFLLRGGLYYVRAGASTFTLLKLTGWRAGVNTTAGFSISANGTRSSDFFDENLMGAESLVVTIHGHKYAKVTEVLLFFNTTSAGVFNGVFGTPPTAGDLFGAVTFLARLK
jgi:hypothetical protein